MSRNDLRGLKLELKSATYTGVTIKILFQIQTFVTMKKTFCTSILFIIAINITINAQSVFNSFLDSAYSIIDSTSKVNYVEDFFEEIRGINIPFIEGDTAYFVYNDNASKVEVVGDFNIWGNMGIWMCKNLPGTNFFYFPRAFEHTARLDYKLIIDSTRWINDPNNPNTITGGYGSNSELAMPGYVQPWEIELYEDVSKGSIEKFSLVAEELDRSYNIQVYLPPDYEASSDKLYPTVYVHDGQEYLDLASMENVLNNLIDSNKINPLIVVFIEPNNRDEEYAYDLRYSYAQFVVTTLVDYIDSNYNTMKSNKSRLTMGDSFAGNISGLIAYTHPDVFANCGWHSPAFWPNDSEVANMYTGSHKDIRIYFTVGSYEGIGVDLNDFINSLTALNYDFDWDLYYEGHSWGQWRATIDNILMHFFPFKPALDISTPFFENNPAAYIYPNPWSISATLLFKAEKPGNYRLVIYNHLNQIIYRDEKRFDTSGDCHFTLDGSEFTDGLFIYVIDSEGYKYTGKMIKRF